MHAARAAVRVVSLCLGASLLTPLAACTGDRPQGAPGDTTQVSAGQEKVAGTLPPLPPGFPTPVISGSIPTFVASLPDSVATDTMARPWFDSFSWQSFIALNWPADTATGRGNPLQPNSPAVFLNASNSAPVTWGTYKESYELFDQGNARPTAFDSWQTAQQPCSGVLPRQKVFVMTSKGNSIMDESVEAFSLPLVDQDSNYVRYEIRYNRAQYDTIRGPDADSTLWLYLATNLRRHSPFQMPATDSAGATGALMVKAAWREMTAHDDTTRYLLVHALVLNDTTCTPHTMGLVGMHIAQKLSGFPEWIWSTFEHVSNVPGPGSVAPYSFNNGDSLPRTPTGWANRPDSATLVPKSQRVPTQVTRLNPIPSTPASASTQWVNQLYHTLLAQTVWVNYQLVVTQWPTTPNTFKQFGQGVYPAAAGMPFPVNGATNTSAETYFQSQQDAYASGGNSCMQCHWDASKTDFSWGLLRRAH